MKTSWKLRYVMRRYPSQKEREAWFAQQAQYMQAQTGLLWVAHVRQGEELRFQPCLPAGQRPLPNPEQAAAVERKLAEGPAGILRLAYDCDLTVKQVADALASLRGRGRVHVVEDSAWGALSFRANNPEGGARPEAGK